MLRGPFDIGGPRRPGYKPRMQKYSELIVGLCCAALTVACGVWWIADARLVDESAPRIVAGAALVFLVPGLLCGELFGFRSRHPWQTVAIGFGLSMLVEIIAAGACLLCGATIAAWGGAVLGWCAAAIVVVAVRALRGRRFAFLASLVPRPARNPAELALGLAVLVVPVVAAVLAYRWGDKPDGVGGESLLHISYIRLYRELPLVLADLGPERGAPPPNFVHWWEFLLAGWSRICGVDPLPIFHRARFVVPLLAGASLYWLVQAVFMTRRRATVVFLAIAAVCASGLPFQGASSLSWILATDPTRGVFAFYGTANHGDVALDVLLPLCGAAAWEYFRRRNRRTAIMLVATLVTAFLMHPRELLQTGYAVGLAAPAILTLRGFRDRRSRRAWLATLGLVALTALGCIGASLPLVARGEHGIDEMGIKRRVLQAALEPQNVAGVRGLFHFPFHFLLNERPKPTDYSAADIVEMLSDGAFSDAWLYLAAISIIVCAILGGRADRQVAVYCYLLWLLTLCWNTGVLAVTALTYSEFYMSTPRLFHVPAYLAIGAALTVCGSRTFQTVSRAWPASGRRQLVDATAKLATALIGLVLGAIFKTTFVSSPVGLAATATALSFAAPMACLVAAIRERLRPAEPRGYLVPASLFVIGFFAPLFDDARDRFLAADLARYRPAIDWWSDDNPFGLSPRTIQWVRTAPAGSRILIHPFESKCLSLYGPVYLAISPVDTVLRDRVIREEIRVGKHPLYCVAWNDAGEADRNVAATMDHRKILGELAARQVDFLLVDGARYEGYVGAYIQNHPETYEIVVDDPTAREMVVAVHRTPPEIEKVPRT